MTSRGGALRAQWAGGGMAVAPGVYDGITGRLVEQAGYACTYMTGAGTAAAHGFPDYGLLTGSEMAANAARIAGAIAIPLVADADTGYGNELNVTRTVRDFEAAGAAAIHIEDQVSPKRCGHLDGKEVIAADEFVVKIRAAVAARRDADFVLIARTDARAMIGIDEAIRRANLALDAGADMAFVEAVWDQDELARVPREVRGPCLLNIVPGGKTPEITLSEARALGYRLAILPGLLLKAILPAIDTALHGLRQTDRPEPTPPDDTVAATFRRFGAGEWDEVRRAFARPPS